MMSILKLLPLGGLPYKCLGCSGPREKWQKVAHFYFCLAIQKVAHFETLFLGAPGRERLFKELHPENTLKINTGLRIFSKVFFRISYLAYDCNYNNVFLVISYVECFGTNKYVYKSK